MLITILTYQGLHTALSLACKAGRTEVAIELLAAGASVAAVREVSKLYNFYYRIQIINFSHFRLEKRLFT